MTDVATPEAKAAETPAEPGFRIEPQPGPQTEFAATTADIAIIGGGAYGGKSFALLMAPLPFIDIPEFASVAFRRETPQLRNPGGLWYDAKRLYRRLEADTADGPMVAVWPSGATTKFWHLQYDDSVYDWDSSQIPLIMFDQLESFSEMQFFYMLSRNRDPSGKVKPFVRAACNPWPDSWLKRFLGWWIDDKTGYAIPERSGVVRWMVRIDDTLHWAASREDLFSEKGARDETTGELLPEADPRQIRPMSVTFIVARIWDNKIGLANDPGYLAKLMAQARHERERLLGDDKLGGNWNAKASAGSLFRREWCEKLAVEPGGVVDWHRGWDLAATKPHPGAPDPDWTVGVRMGRYPPNHPRYSLGKRFVIAADVKRMRDNPGPVRATIKRAAEEDVSKVGPSIVIRLPQDPGQAGKAQGSDFIRDLAGFTVRVNSVTGDKVVRFSPFSVQAEAGAVDYVDGIPDEYLAGLEAFPRPNTHDDDVDATSEAFAGLVGGLTGDQVLDYFRTIGGGLPTKKAEDTTSTSTDSPLGFAVKTTTGPRVSSQAGVADAIAVATADPEAPFSDSLRVRTTPYNAFAFGAGRRYTADGDGYITAAGEEDLLVLLRAGCARAPEPKKKEEAA